jgi:hypothetical protein
MKASPEALYQAIVYKISTLVYDFPKALVPSSHGSS